MALPGHRRRIVFYSEGPASWVHLEPLVRHLVAGLGQTICYLSSLGEDPGLARRQEGIVPFLIGEGAARTLLFRFLKAGVMVMTMPDLETFHIKRSINPVHYVYVHHSLVSTHMAYRPGAFDHFDTVFCAGPHHEEEIRRQEELSGLREKDLFSHGYGRLDNILREVPGRPRLNPSSQPRILIAPSWGPAALLETRGEELVETLLEAGIYLTVRPHPETRRYSPSVLDRLLARFRDRTGFTYEENIASQDSLHQSHLMISDWSGAALDYAFGLERPVLFVDVPRKVNNPRYEDLGFEPLEVAIRNRIGEVLPAEAIHEAPLFIRRLLAVERPWVERIRAERARWVFNVGESGVRGAERIAELADQFAPPQEG